jgi:hypothetical protein
VIISGQGEGAPGISQVVAAGPIRGVGTVEFDETNEDIVRFVFPDGSITLDAPEDEGSGSEEFNERTCSGSFTFSGPFEIIDGTAPTRARPAVAPSKDEAASSGDPP